MGAIAFSSRTGHAASVSNWLSSAQAMFAFFAPPPSSPHAQADPTKNARAPLLIPRQTPIRIERQSVSPSNSAVIPASQTTGFAKTCATPVAPKLVAGDRACLKILREFEPGKSRSSTGRLVISGRMVDVCAALDRMAVQSAEMTAKQ